MADKTVSVNLGKLGKYDVRFSRFPNQGYGWFPHKNGQGGKALLNPQGSRFGGGWNWKLGLSVGNTTVMLDVLFGIVTIRRVLPESRSWRPGLVSALRFHVKRAWRRVLAILA